MKPRLICSFGDKGGVGKSLVARSLAESLIASGRKPLLVDADPSVGHLLRYLGSRGADRKTLFPQPPDGVQTYDLHGSADARVEFGRVLESGRDLILVDLPASSATLLRGIEADYGLFQWAHEADYAVTLVVSITPDPASMFSVKYAHDADSKADIVVVRNAGFGDPVKHFIAWDGSQSDALPVSYAKDLLQRLGGREITLPDLDKGTLALVGVHGLAFRDVADGHVGPGRRDPLIGPRRRQISRWLDEARDSFASCGEILGFEPVRTEVIA